MRKPSRTGIDDLIVDAHLTAAADEHVDLLGVIMAMVLEAVARLVLQDAEDVVLTAELVAVDAAIGSALQPARDDRRGTRRVGTGADRPSSPLVQLLTVGLHSLRRRPG